MPAQLDGLETAANQKKKQTSFDITNTPLVQKGQRQALPSIADMSPPVQQVPGDADRARRMQVQFDQPVSKGIPPGGILSGLPGFDSTGQPFIAQHRAGGIAGGLGAGGKALNPLIAPTQPLPAKEDNTLANNPLTAPTQPIQPSGQGYALTGIGAGMAGGEIAGRRGANGVMEFTNEAATPGAVTSARPMPNGGIGGIGDGIGTFSQMQPGDSQLALERFGRANDIRAETIKESRRGGIGEGGGRVTVVRDSSRSPSIADIQNARLDSRQAQTNLQQQQAQQGILAGLDERLTGQLQRQRLQQDLQAGEVANQRSLELNGILAGLTDPSLKGEARTQAERNYLLQADPQAFLEQQGKAGIAQVDLEKKQLERDLLRLELERGGSSDGIKLTEQQSKDLGYYARGNEANAQLASQGDALTARATGERGRLRGIADTVVRGTPLVGDSSIGNSLVSNERQQAEQAGREVLSAILRKDTGAAITNQEMEIYGRMYLPQPGDSDEVLNQKAEARTRALASIRSGLGTAERKATPLRDGKRTTSDAPVQVSSDSDYDALPSGATFIAPDGSTRRKP